MKKYYIASPFSSINHGITNYVQSAVKILQNAGVDATIIESPGPFRRAQYEEHLISLVKGGIVEIPDTQGMFSDGCTQFDLHVRLHAPIVKLESINQKKQSVERFEREAYLISNAKIVSSPTCANIKAYKECGIGGFEHFLAFPNPLDFQNMEYSKQRDIDVVFIGRHERLKGVDLLRQTLMHYPKDVKVAILGVKEEYKEYFSSDKFLCEIDFVGWTDNTIKYQYLCRSKTCIMLSRFESYSMVVAEAISCGCNVLAWNVAGAPEAFYGAPIQFIDPFDVRLMAAASLESLQLEPPEIHVVEHFIGENNAKYINGIKSILFNSTEHLKYTNFNAPLAPSFYPTKEALQTVTKNFVALQSKKNFKLVGVSMNSESAENMWGCLLQNLFTNYKLYSRHPLGTYYKKGFDTKYPIDPLKYEVTDWFKNTKQAAIEVSSQNADILFLFNGNTQKYRELVSRLYDCSDLNPVYSELGWLPQNNHVYFDTRGANAHSSIRWATLESLCGKIEECIYQAPFVHKKALLTLQLPGDTTLQKDAFPRSLDNQNLIKYVRSQTPKDFHIIVRQHPMDNGYYHLENMENISFDTAPNFSKAVENVDIVIGVNSTILLEAMQYPVNIYALGYGVFSSKGVLIDCSKQDLGSCWLDNIYFDAKRREAFLSYLSERQLNVSLFDSQPLEFWSEALYPIYLSHAVYESERELGVRHGRPRSYVTLRETTQSLRKNLVNKVNPKILKNNINDLTLQERILRLERKLTKANSRIEKLEVTQNLWTNVLKTIPIALFNQKSSNPSLRRSFKDNLYKKLHKLRRSPKTFFIDFVLKHRGSK